MEAIAPVLSWLGSALQQASALPSPAPVKSAVAAPVSVAPMIPVSPVSLGLKVLLEPVAGGVLFRAACNTVATIYPVYATAKAIESKDTKDDIQWLSYWAVYGSFILAEHFADQALGKVPYYYHLKFAALLWLQLPQTRGATFLYDRYYKPALAKYGPKVDKVLAKAQDVLNTLYATYKVPIDATLALALAAQQQVAAAVRALLSDDAAKKGAAADKGEKANAA
ncbi:hypothetical protein HYH03_017967 [Edaphochlamys debaryana]|uniref:HVA22-like protein n=1 Tax=Edaphochlamys debaryana TaxID=47281 RepID=A0A836BNM4_9CHLO|nr:hypothetical protein HYH03_017967 [Edaphochlamys debaryana]|eukprot:KAG2483175.1 hypothetical protein HYH03_017967 [Edaphochlamys debaryana]